MKTRENYFDPLGCDCICSDSYFFSYMLEIFGVWFPQKDIFLVWALCGLYEHVLLKTWSCQDLRGMWWIQGLKDWEHFACSASVHDKS